MVLKCRISFIITGHDGDPSQQADGNYINRNVKIYPEMKHFKGYCNNASIL